MKKEQFRWYLQIRFKNNGDPFFMRTWCINEPYNTLKECEEIAEGLLDETVDKMRIADGAKNEVYKTYR
jgi:hypothetical protein